MPKCHVLPFPLTKVHQIRYVRATNKTEELENELLAVSTEDGRILFYSTAADSLIPTEQSNGKPSIPAARLRCQLDGKTPEQSSRIKDFEFLTVKADSGQLQTFVVVTAGSDGAIKLWLLDPEELCPKEESKNKKGKKKESASEDKPKIVGRLLGMYETGNRITCLKAFVMTKATEDDDDLDEFSGLSEQEESEPESSSEEEEEED